MDGKQIAVMEVTRVTALNEHPVRGLEVLIGMKESQDLGRAIFSILDLILKLSR